MNFRQISFLREKIKRFQDSLLSSKKEEIDFFEFIKFIFSNVKGPHLVKHTFDVAKISLFIAQEFNLSGLERSILYWASILHDLGKVHMPDEIILSPHRVTEEEYTIIKMHPRISKEIASAIPVFRQEFPVNNLPVKITDIVLYHHERIDGKGYFGLKQTEIPYLAKIIAVADAFAAMTDATRRFNKSRSSTIENVIARMKYDCGTYFDTEIVEVFEASLKKYGNNINPDIDDVNEIFSKNNSGNSLPLIKITELFSFIERFIDKQREITISINNKSYVLTEFAEWYIINQRPDTAYITIYEGEKEKELAAVTQKKRTMSQEEVFHNLQFQEKDLKHAYSFMEEIGDKFLFTELNLTQEAFRKKLNRFGSFTKDEFRVFLEDNLVGHEKIKDTQDYLEKFFLTEEMIKEIDPGVFSVQNINIIKTNEPNSSFDLQKGLEFLETNYVENVEVKRELILKKWEEVKEQTIVYNKNESLPSDKIIDDETLLKIARFIDYIPKINFRGVDLLKLEYLIEGVSGVYFSKEKDLNSSEIRKALFFYYLIEMTVLLDKYYMHKDVVYSSEMIYNTLIRIKELFLELKKTLNLLIFKFDHKKRSFLFSDLHKKWHLVDIILDFYGTNGSIGFVLDKHTDSKERRALLSWLKNNKKFINPVVLDEFEEILDKQ